MSKLTDDVLIKRSTHAGRNLALLAVLSSLLTAVIIGVAIFSKETIMLLWFCAASLLILSTGYWLLAIAAKRGNPNAVGTVLVVLVLHIVLALVMYGVVASLNENSEPPNVANFIVPILVIMALSSSRNILIELKKRDLWDRVFANARPSRSICLTGGILFTLGFILLNGSIVYSGFAAGRERAVKQARAQTFVLMLKTEEAAFMGSLAPLTGQYGEQEFRNAMDRLSALEQKSLALQDEAGKDHQLSNITFTYCSAVKQWKQALMALGQPEADTTQVQNLLAQGDKLRLQALQDFDRCFSTGKKPNIR